MTEPTERPIGQPAIGEELIVPVVDSPTRTTLFPDQAVIASSPSGLDVIFLRSEPRVMHQRVRVTRVGDGSADVQPFESGVMAQLCDIGHVRLPTSIATETAIQMLGLLMQQHNLQLEEVIQKLTDVATKAISRP